MVSWLMVVVVTPVAAALVAFLSFLFFCAYVVRTTQDTLGLRDVAKAVRAFSSVARIGRTRRLDGRAPPRA